MFADWRFYAILSALFAALTSILGKVGVAEMDSNLATFVRTVVILAFSAAIVSVTKAWKLPGDLNRTSVIFLILSGIATGASWLCYYRALQLGPASRVAPIDKLSVVITVILAAIFLGERLTWMSAAGGLLIVAGSILMVL